MQILRDADGIVTIRAENDADAAFALGYVHAQDRLVQMEMMRRLVAGRLSEVVGSMTLSTDRTMRVLGLYRAAEQSEALLPDDTRARLEAYAAGVNAYHRRAYAAPGHRSSRCFATGPNPGAWRTRSPGAASWRCGSATTTGWSSCATACRGR